VGGPVLVGGLGPGPTKPHPKSGPAHPRVCAPARQHQRLLGSVRRDCVCAYWPPEPASAPIAQCPVPPAVEHGRQLPWDAESSSSLAPTHVPQHPKPSAGRPGTILGDRSFSAAGPRLWNDLPPGLRRPGITFDSFKKSLKTHLFGDRSA